MLFMKKVDYIMEHEQALYGWALLIAGVSFIPVFLLSYNHWFVILRSISDTGLILSILFLALLFILLVYTVVRISFHKELLLRYKIRIIILAYFLLALFFANFYYCLHSMEDMGGTIVQLYYKGISIVDKEKVVELEQGYHPSLSGTKARLWHVDHIDKESGDVTIKRANTLKVYIECLYFSVTTITTTGYGDIFPVSVIARIGAMAEMIAGQAIAVLALGIWLNSYKT